MSDGEKERLLRLLEAHGQAFLKSTCPTNTDSTKQDRGEPSDHEVNAEEWYGINAHVTSPQYESSNSGIFEHSDDEFIPDSGSTIVFSDVSSRPTLQDLSGSQMRAFMSSKISKLKGLDHPQPRKTVADRDEDWTNMQNDVLLHKLIHTKLLSGSLSQDLKLPPAKKRKALEGRILELTGDAKLGKGESQVRETEKNKAAKRVREGISQKQKERRKKGLEEAKNLGNYHPSLKRVFEASAMTNTRKREKGLGMGVGNFSQGSLRLSRDDISRVMGEGQDRSRKRR